MSCKTSMLFLVILLTSIIFGIKPVLANDLKECKHNEITFDIIDIEADCFLDMNGELNQKMLKHHNTGLLETSDGVIYSEKIHNHFNPIDVWEDLDINDPNCIPSERKIVPNNNVRD